MARTASTCPDCGQRWPQREARFCGRCGTGLTAEDGPRPRRFQPATAIFAMALVAMSVALVAGVASLDLADLADRDGGTSVDVGDGLAVRQSPLTPAEADALRRRADTARLRCQPQGCEMWRLERDDILPEGGVVGVDDDLVLLLGGPSGFGGPVDEVAASGDPGAPGPGVRAHHLAAYDTATGRHRWSLLMRDLVPAGDASPFPTVRLQAGPQAALVLSGSAVTSIDADGEVVWRWRQMVRDHADHHLWSAVASADRVLVSGAVTSGTRFDALVTVLDASDGTELWSIEASEIVIVEEDLLVLVDGDQRLTSLDPATGEVLWQHDQSSTPDGWIQRSGELLSVPRARGVTVLVDPRSGDPIATVEGQIVSAFQPANGRLVGVTLDPEVATAGGQGALSVVLIDADGEVAWTTRLANHDAWWDCCSLQVDDALVTIRSPSQWWRIELATGEVVDLHDRASNLSPDDGGNAGEVWQVAADLVLQRHPGGHGIDLRTPEGDMAVRGGPNLTVASSDPLIVRDGHQLMGVRPVRER